MRQLLLDSEPNEQSLVHISGKQYKYLITVLRLDIGSVFEGRTQDGFLYTLRIMSIDAKERSVCAFAEPAISPSTKEIQGLTMAPLSRAASTCDIVLFQWMLKGPKMDQLIRQATEAGVHTIVPVVGDRSMVRDAHTVGEGKTERWRRIIREALQQSGSPVPTKLLEPVDADSLSGVWSQMHREREAVGLVLTEAPLARKSLHEYLISNPSVICIAVGPEGGMTAQELTLLTNAGFSPVHFKTNILRAETAAIYGIAAVQVVITEYENWQLKE